MSDEITNPFANFNGYTIDIWKWKIITSQTLLGMCLLIHAGIEIKPG